MWTGASHVLFVANFWCMSSHWSFTRMSIVHSLRIGSSWRGVVFKLVQTWGFEKVREVVLIKISDLIRFLIQPCKIGSSCVRKGCKQVFPYGTSLKNHMATKHGGGKLLMMISLERGHCQVGEEELTRGRKQPRDRGWRICPLQIRLCFPQPDKNHPSLTLV